MLMTFPPSTCTRISSSCRYFLEYKNLSPSPSPLTFIRCSNSIHSTFITSWSSACKEIEWISYLGLNSALAMAAVGWNK
ncbi:hypothetical protein MPTK1_6g14770 [Marchantia polymorpha subsp. ruderalis]|uniref:Uncharacterized protein n=2 Tax=Marchantia polymorpha TaxID=3197 RepID=A0AAF6BS39_MARPO|nr:hypothetical protein MARPO_0047s0132 [Marchantia polymorpha]BBN14823.1 hypothetical protein Mp_6g14770 [Marchantia polymorpha subsp. ruderalis]|eukprot:PTQ39169.1 hypothetical protein MARPO_0047s0132 [Marchantia polymorpha]